MTNFLWYPNRWVLSIAGVILILIGVYAIASPFIATLLSIITLGWLLVLGGIVQLFYSFSIFRNQGFLTHFILALFSILLGILILNEPELAAASLTLLVAFFFLVLGLFRIFSSIFYRFESWKWFLFVGVLDVILGVLILLHWPSSALWVIGLFVGLDFLFMGWAFLTTSFLLKKIS